MEQQVITDISLSARIIGAAFYYPPTEKSDIVELLSSGKWLTEWPYGSEEEKQRIASLLAQTTYQDETLAQAYQRLFIGPYALPAPPWGSVYLDHENVLFGDSTLDLREWMLENGIDIALTQNEPEDHFGLMVMMVAWVAETRPEKLTELLAEHLLPWAYRYQFCMCSWIICRCNLINSMSNHLAIFHDHRAKGTPTNFHILCGKRNGLLYKLLI